MNEIHLDTNANLILSPAEIKDLTRNIQEDLDKYPYKFPDNMIMQDGHFENGHYLHSNQYYFAKSYFQSSENSDKLAKLLASKICELELKECTLVGFRNYSGLLLSKTKALLRNTPYSIRYAILEQLEENKFTWQYEPNLKNLNKNLVVVLPVTCTCSTYIRIRKFLQVEIRKWKLREQKKWRIKGLFLNIFLIYPSALKNVNQSINLDSSEKPTPIEDIKELYHGFNWQTINPDSIQFKGSDDGKQSYTGYQVIKLYSNLYLPESCPLCFPELAKKNLSEEKNIFPTHDNFETPNLLLELPKFAYTGQTDTLFKTHATHLQKETRKLFTNLFCNDNVYKQSYLYGYYNVDRRSYISYIRGNTFYQQNRVDILKFFNAVLTEILTEKKIKKIIFITQGNKHNCSFLEEISTYRIDEAEGILAAKENNKEKYLINILRYNPKNEFIDNFMSNYADLIKHENDETLTIFFQEIISGGNTFKLLSDYIKHYRNKENEIENRHGFDYVFSIIDRTPFNTRKEILKKLASDQNAFPEKCFISFFNLNVPVISAAHLGNPLLEKVNSLNKLIKESALDILKQEIGNELPHKIGKALPEERGINNVDAAVIQYFPFENADEKILPEVFAVYRDIIKSSRLDLLKLYISHELNSYLSQDPHQKNANLVRIIVDTIWLKIKKDEEEFFTTQLNSKNRLIGNEQAIVHDTVIKILSSHPFTYYNKIATLIFNYCLKKFEAAADKIIDNNGILDFQTVRTFKFYIRRLVELDSSILISNKVIRIIKMLFEQNKEGTNTIENLKTKYEDSKSVIPDTTGDELQHAIKTNLSYKYAQLNSFYIFLLFCYKESVYKNFYRSIKLEELMNSREFLPSILLQETDGNHEFINYMQDAYFLLSGMIKAENNYLLEKLKQLHKNKVQLFYNQKKALDENTFLTPQDKQEQIQELIASWLDPASIQSILHFYFESWKSDPIILNARKFISKSIIHQHAYPGKENIKVAVANMLRCISLLADDNKAEEFSKDIHTILRAVTHIFQPEDESIKTGGKPELGYILCLKYRNRSGENKAVDNIYIISSDKSHLGAKLNSEGIIYNLMEGMYDSPEKINVSDEDFFEKKHEHTSLTRGAQSLLAVVKHNNCHVSFREEYFICSKGKLVAKKFSDLYANESSIPLLSNSTMSLFFRLSEINELKLDKGECALDGKAVLIITSSEKFTPASYASFINNEKIRLLLLIKNELMKYLEKITGSDTFWELVKSIERIQFVSLMKHGILNYFDSVNELLNNKAKLNNNEILLVQLLNKILETQFKSLIHKISKEDNPNSTLDHTIKRFSQEEIKGLFKAILELPGITSLSIKNGYDLEILADNFQCPKAIYYHVIPELFINIRKQTFLMDRKKVYKIIFEDNILTIQNSFDWELTPNPVDKKINGGREMCKTICKELGIYFSYSIDVPNMVYTVTLKF
ncbi:MAG: hypothetical protein JO072_08210 [Parafilimonas sp.]|nr:hypothetical protein [Parafilimonas sp.]